MYCYLIPCFIDCFLHPILLSAAILIECCANVGHGHSFYTIAGKRDLKANFFSGALEIFLLGCDAGFAIYGTSG